MAIDLTQMPIDLFNLATINSHVYYYSDDDLRGSQLNKCNEVEWVFYFHYFSNDYLDTTVVFSACWYTLYRLFNLSV